MRKPVNLAQACRCQREIHSRADVLSGIKSGKRMAAKALHTFPHIHSFYYEELLLTGC